MNRREFLKVLSLAGGVALSYPLLNELPDLKEYPKVTYERVYSHHMLTNLHILRGEDKDDVLWEVAEYSDEKHLPKEMYDMMLKELYERIV